MQSIDLIRQNLVRSRDLALARVEEMRDHCTVPPTPRGGGHTLWVLGHLAYIEHLVVRDFMLGGGNPLAEWGEQFDADDVPAEGYPHFDEVLEACRQSRALTLETLDALSEADLDAASANAPEAARTLFGTRRDCLQYAADHWLMHRGQLADARRAAGLDRMWY